MEEKLTALLSHPFYIKAKEQFEVVRQGQIVKGAEKYNEPFTPSSWTNAQLGQHALEEVVDLNHYLCGMIERMEYQNNYILLLEKQNNELKEREVIQGDSWRVLLDVKSERTRQDNIHPKELNVYKNLAVLIEEVGEVGTALQNNDSKNLYEELIQVAAVAVKMAEQVKGL